MIFISGKYAPIFRHAAAEKASMPPKVNAIEQYALIESRVLFFKQTMQRFLARRRRDAVSIPAAACYFD